MAEILEAYQNSPTFNIFEWDSIWINTGNSSKIIFTGYSNIDYRIGMRWSVSENNPTDIIEEEFVDILSGTSKTFVTDIKAKFIQFFVLDLNTLPCILRTQAFFILDRKL